MSVTSAPTFLLFRLKAGIRKALERAKAAGDAVSPPPPSGLGSSLKILDLDKYNKKMDGWFATHDDQAKAQPKAKPKAKA